MPKRSVHHSLLLTYIITSTIVVLIPLLVVGVLWYRDATSRIFDEIVELNRERLDRTVHETERIFEELRDASVLMSVERKLRRRFVEENPINTLEAMEVLGYYKLRVPGVSYLILSYTDDTVLYTSEARFEEFFFLEEELQVDPEQMWELHELLRDARRPTIVSGIRVGVRQGDPEHAIAYVHPVALGPTSARQGTAAFILTDTALRTQILRVAGPLDGILTVRDEQGATVFSMDGTNWGARTESTMEDRVDTDQVILSAESSFPRVTYQLVIPAPAFLERLVQLRRTLSVVLAVTVLLGAALAILIAYRNYRPIGRLAASIAPHAADTTIESNGNELDRISAALNLALEKVDEAAELANSHHELAAQSLLATALKRAPSATEREEFAQLGLPSTFDCGMVSVIAVQSTRRRGIISDRERVLDIVATHRRSDWEYFSVELLQREAVAVVAVSADCTVNDPAVRTRVGNELLRACTAHGVSVKVAVGSLCEDWNGIHPSFLDALTALDDLGTGAASVAVVYDPAEGSSSEHEIWFPTQQLERLVRSVEFRSGALVLHSIDELIEAIRTRSLSQVMLRGVCQYVATNLSTALVSLLGPNAAPHVSKLLPISHLDELETRLRSIASDPVLDRSDGSAVDADMAAGVRRTIADRYLDPNFSLLSLADEYKVSIYYMSRFFQKAFGMKFSEYIQDLRLREAERLLLSTDMTVTDVAHAVCYQNSSHFIRFFKTLRGTTPAVFRANAQ